MYEWLAEYMGGDASSADAQDFVAYLSKLNYTVPGDEGEYRRTGIVNAAGHRLSAKEFHRLLNDWYLEFCH